MQNVSPVLENKCYYYIERVGADQFTLFLLCPLSEGQSVVFSKGIETDAAWNVLMENDQAMNSTILELGKKKYAFIRMEFEDENSSKEEIVIHSYIAKGDYIVPSEVSIILDKSDLPSISSEEVTPDEIAYNKPYVYLYKSPFVEPDSPKTNLRFYPRVLLPLVGYKLAGGLDIISPSNNVDDEQNENIYTAIVPLIKSDEFGIKINDPSDLLVNSQYYFDTEKIEGSFRVIVPSFLDRQSELNSLRKVGDFKAKVVEASKRGNDAKINGMSGDSITRKPVSRGVVAIPTSGLFID